MIITIDGPGASGKSSLAQAVAEKLCLYYLCSGMLYRACAYILHHYAGYSAEKIAHPTTEDVEQYCNQYRIRYVYTLDNGIQIFFDNHDITAHLKSATIDLYSSLVSADNAVRIEVHRLQRAIAQEAIAQERDLIADGRDMGSVAFPDADYKFFVTASVDARARRWQKDQASRNNKVSLEEAVVAISERDERDTHRAHAPLVVPDGAILIDNTDLTLEETEQLVLSYIKK
jgi:cytidylate kinase